jgi:DNA-binding MarR family transcriptional regulator
LPKSPDRFNVGERWTPELAKGGWTPIVNTFLERQHLLGLSPTEVLVLIHLVSFKWGAAPPRPSAGKIAARMGLSETAVRNNLRALEKKGLLVRMAQKGRANHFDLEPLFERLSLTDDELQAAMRRQPQTD